MTENRSDMQDLSPEEVGARVTAILAAAERDARATIEAARREVLAATGVVEPAPRESAPLVEHGSEAVSPALAALMQALDSLSSRLSAVERTIDARLEILWRALAPGAGEQPGPGGPTPAREQAARAERLRAVDLAVRGFSREQIAVELRSTLPDTEIERLLDEVLERA